MKNAGLVAIRGYSSNQVRRPLTWIYNPPSCHGQGSDGTVDVGISGLDEATSSTGQVVNGEFYSIVNITATKGNFWFLHRILTWAEPPLYNNRCFGDYLMLIKVTGGNEWPIFMDPHGEDCFGGRWFSDQMNNSVKCCNVLPICGSTKQGNAM